MVLTCPSSFRRVTEMPSELENKLQVQSRRKLDLWQGCHEIVEKIGCACSLWSHQPDERYSSEGSMFPPLLKAWAEGERKHGGVIFVDEKTISPSDTGGLVRALSDLSRKTARWDWTNRVCFLRR